MQAPPYIYNSTVQSPCQSSFLCDIIIKEVKSIMVMKEGTKSIYFRIPEQLKLQIEMEAVRQGRSVNNLLTYIVTEYLKNQKK